MPRADEPDDDDLEPIDARYVLVSWGADDEWPSVDLGNTSSAWEAIGLLRGAVRGLENEYAFGERRED